MAEKTSYFPMFFDLKGKCVLVAGGGSVGARVLADFGAEVTVSAPEGCESLQIMEQAGDIVWNRREFRDSDLEGCFLAIAATSDEGVNVRIVELCRKNGILANHAGDHAQCDFYFPAIARHGELMIGVTSSGSDHGLVRSFAAKLRKWVADGAER